MKLINRNNALLLVLSIFFSLIILEFFLFFLGRYKNLTINNLKPSLAIYERASSSIQKHKHPDLDFTITNYFDLDGVKNFDKITTSKKKNIIGIFGDSFTENIAIPKKFEYTNLVNQLLENNDLINYGTGGYSADQVFIRYLKYKDHDIKHVFYLLMPGDQGFSTKSIFNDDGSYSLEEPKLNFFYQLLGKLNITYLMIDTYYLFKSMLSKNFTYTKKENYNSILANKIYKKFYNNDLNKCEYDLVDKNCKIDLLNLLEIFKKEVENNGGQFHILVYPDKDYISYFNEILSLRKNRLNYYILDRNLTFGSSINGKNINFDNDSHWNEYGNYAFANNLIDIFNLIGIQIKNKNFNINFNDIDSFYEEN